MLLPSKRFFSSKRDEEVVSHYNHSSRSRLYYANVQKDARELGEAGARGLSCWGWGGGALILHGQGVTYGIVKKKCPTESH